MKGFPLPDVILNEVKNLLTSTDHLQILRRYVPRNDRWGRLVLLATALLLSACNHKELSFDYDGRSSLRVVFDWQHAPEARPEGMSLYLFPKGGGEGWRYDFPGREGGILRIPADTYNLLSYNNDSEVAMFRNTDRWETFEVSTHDASIMQILMRSSADDKLPRAKGTEDERLVYSVDSLWCGSLDDLTVLQGGGDTLVTLMPQSAVQTYWIEVRNVVNLQYVSKLAATVSSMAGGVRVADGSLSDEVVTVSFGMEANIVENSIEGTFTTFGHCAGADNTHQLVLYCMMQDGSKMYYTFDITQRLHEVDEVGNRVIVIDNLTLPGPVGDNGFNAGADEWETVNIEIKM